MDKATVIFFGPDGVGKTVLLYKLKFDKIFETIPTIGFNVEEIEYKNKKIKFWDITGNENKRNLWGCYLEKYCECITFVVDISKKEKIDLYIECLNLIVKYLKDNNKNIPIIIFGNKFNDKKEFDPQEILSKSNIPPEIQTKTFIGNPLSGEGLSDFLEYIYNIMEFRKEETKNDETKEEKTKNEDPIKDDFKVKMFGLNDSGKTKILFLLKLKQNVLTIPSMGFNVEEIKNENWEKSVTIWDIAGNKKLRKLWVYYYENTNGIIWVYDISIKELYEESQNELKKVLDSDLINKSVPLLIYANKDDLNKNGNHVEEFLSGIKDYLGNRPYFIQVTNCDNYESCKSGLDWLYQRMKENN